MAFRLLALCFLLFVALPSVAMAEKAEIIGDDLGVGVSWAAKFPSLARNGVAIHGQDILDQIGQLPRNTTAFMSLGIYDAVSGDINVKKPVQDILAAAKALDVKLVWLGPPCVFKPWDVSSKQLDEVLHDELAGTGVIYVSMRGSDICDRSLRGAEGVHFNLAGYTMMWQKAAAAAGFPVVTISAETALSLDCKPDLEESTKDGIVAISVAVRGRDWSISHIAASGVRYERANQYSLRDASNAGVLSWEGTKLNRPYLKMVGQISGSGTQFAYIESIYDTRKVETKTTELRASCTLVAAISPSSSASEGTASMRTLVQTQKEGGTFVVPVLINGAITLNFTIDSGASDVSVPIDVVFTLMRTGTLSTSDFLGSKTYTLADGRSTPSETFRIRSLKVGDRVLENITASVAPVAGSLLLGQSFLSQFKSWSFDNQRQMLILE